MLLPFKHHTNAANVTVTQGTDLDDMSADIYIIERLWRPDISLVMAEQLIQKIKRYNKKFIYTLDDNLLDLAFNRGGDIWPTAEHKTIVRMFAREADGIIVSTRPLKQRFDKFNNKVVVVENALDDSFQVFRKLNDTRPQGEVIFGYMGTPSHESDLMMILPAIKEILCKNDKVQFQVVGVMDQTTLSKVFGDLNVKLLDTTGNVEYPRFMKWMAEKVRWDFAIAPLEENKFTICKSDIKLLDYGIFKIGGIFSDVTVYRENVRHMDNGMLIENDNESWYSAIEYMIRESVMRAQIGDNVFNYVLNKRTLNRVAPRWVEAIKQIVD